MNRESASFSLAPARGGRGHGAAQGWREERGPGRGKGRAALHVKDEIVDNVYREAPTLQEENGLGHFQTVESLLEYRW